MKEKVSEIKESLAKDLEKVSKLQDIVDIKAKYIGKSGLITDLMKNMKDYSPEERKSIGQIVNVAKDNAESIIKNKEEEINNAILNEKLNKEAVDITLPSKKIKRGSLHPMTRIVEEFEDLFVSMGYTVFEGPELESDENCFQKLNLPKGHPARDAQDTFYVKDDELLLRSHTSPVQARVMLDKKGIEPVRMICPGKAYRRDDDDATHSHQFTQIEGLLVDKNIKLSDLKGTVTIICKRLFGEDTVTRFRPSYYQFTEPSVEMDISCFNCKGQGCNICKKTGWITIGGAGVVNYDVLRGCGYDPEKWSGFAFGFGAERCAMLKYGINDIRTFYNVDLREVKSFDRKDGE